MFSKSRGFTLVELIVVIVVIGILATVTSLGLGRFQKEARDEIRNSSTIAITEALEKYYDKNGEYPGCQLLSRPVSDVASLLKLDQAVLTAPGAAASTNSLRCEEADATTSATFRYVGDESGTCQTGTACLFWTIEYKKESDEQTVALNSRRQVQSTTAGAPTLNGAVASSESVDLTWTVILNASDYLVEYSTSSNFSNSKTTRSATLDTTVDELLQGTRYYFRVNAQLATGATAWSNTRILTTSIDDPDAPTVTASVSGASAVGTVSAVTCSTGSSAQYQQRYRRTASETDGSWSSYSAWGTSRTYTVASATEGYEYTFQAQARCRTSYAQSPAATSNIDTIVIPLTTPGSAAVSVTLSGSTATGTLAAITCPSGSTAQYQMRYRTSNDSANLGTWTSYDTWNGTRTRAVTVNPGYRAGFQGQVRCQSAVDTSDAKTSTEASIVRPYSAITAPGVSVSISGSTATATAVAVTCQAGASPQYSVRTRHSNDSANYGTWSSYPSWSTSRTRSDTVSEGYRRGYQVQARCVGDFNTTSAAAGSEGGAIRQITTTPSAPVYTADTSWNAGYRYRITYSTSCQSGTRLHSEGVPYYNTGFSGSVRNPDSGYWYAPDEDLWWLGWNNNQVHEDIYYYGRYRCQTDFSTSPYSGWRTTKVDVVCSAARRSFNVSPRCDMYGQNWKAQPYGT